MIPTRAPEAFFPLIAPYAGACPDPMMEQAVRLSAIDFCERTRCWRHMVTRQVTRGASALIAPAFAVIHQFENAYFNDQPLTPVQFSKIQDDLITDAPEATAAPEYITQENPGFVTIFPASAGTLKVSCFLKPKTVQEIAAAPSPYDDGEEPTVLPEFLLVQHGETIAAGALRRILSLPGQTFTDLGQAGFYAGIFEEGASRHFAANIRGQHRVAPRSRPHSF